MRQELAYHLIRLLNPPVIIIGMHRSGTSILTRLLQACDFYIGSELDDNFESKFFQELNIALLKHAASNDWVNFESFIQYANNPTFFRLEIEFLKEMVVKDLYSKYFASQFFIQSLNKSTVRWGWKDPRNTLTLPLWLRIFPRAKVIHVIRNGVDVALSLYEREKKMWAETRRFSPETDIPFYFKLWERYTEIGLAYRKCARHYYEIRYEQLLEKSEPVMRSLLGFLNCGFNAKKVTNAIGLLDSAMKDRHRRPEHSNIIKTLTNNSTLFSTLGYS